MEHYFTNYFWNNIRSVYELFSTNSLIQVSWAHLTTFYGFLTGFSGKIGSKHFILNMRWKWNVEDFEKLFNLLAFNVSKPLWFHDLNVTIKIKTAVIMKTTPMMKMLMIFLMRMMKFQKVLFSFWYWRHGASWRKCSY